MRAMKRVLPLFPLCLSLILAPSASAAASAPRLDANFGGRGTAVLPLPDRPWRAGVYDIAQDPAGRLVLAGGIARRSGSGEQTGAQMLALRLRPSGALDPSFGKGGLATGGFYAESEASGVAVQPDGKIVAAGYTNWGNSADINSKYSAAAIRFNPDGSLDPSFKHEEIGASAARDLAIQPNGRIVVVAIDAPYFSFTGRVFAFKRSGERDLGFGRRGNVAIFAPRSRYRQTDLSDVVVQPDGKLVITGEIEGRILVTRLLANGTPDPSFGGGDGRSAVRFLDHESNSIGHAVRLQSDGRIVVLAHESRPGGRDIILTRFLPDGRLDRSFGLHHRGFMRRRDSYALGLAIGPDDSIVVAGRSGRAKDGRFTVLRYLPNGRADPSFGKNGALVEQFGTSSSATAALFDRSGRLVVAGNSTRHGSPTAPKAVVLQRFLP